MGPRNWQFQGSALPIFSFEGKSQSEPLANAIERAGFAIMFGVVTRSTFPDLAIRTELSLFSERMWIFGTPNYDE